MPAEQPTPQEISEAVVLKTNHTPALFFVRTGDYMLEWRRLWSKKTRRCWSFESAARAALAAAQERAGVYARPPAATCACIRFSTVADYHDKLDGPREILGGKESRIGVRWLWTARLRCRYCLRGVPKPAPATPGDTLTVNGIDFPFDEGKVAEPPADADYVAPTYALGQVCEHDRLARQCDVCALAHELAYYKAMIDTPACGHTEPREIKSGSCWRRKADGRLVLVEARNPSDGWIGYRNQIGHGSGISDPDFRRDFVWECDPGKH